MRKDVENLTNRVLQTIKLGKEKYNPLELYDKILEYKKTHKSKLLGNVKVENVGGILFLDGEKQFVIEINNKFESLRGWSQQTYIAEGRILARQEIIGD